MHESNVMHYASQLWGFYRSQPASYQFYIALAVVIFLWHVEYKWFGPIHILSFKFTSRYRDPNRLFSRRQKLIALQNCGYRCEHKPIIGMRCHARHELQGDHIYPWSLGGQTIPSNLQMLCKKHNRRKTNIKPSWLYIKRLERRRRRYFPKGSRPDVHW